MEWYRWRPGSIPQLERASLEERGLAWAVLDYLWTHGTVDPAKTPQDWCFLLGYPELDEDTGRWAVIQRMLELYCSAEVDQAEQFREKKREAGRRGGLASVAARASSTAQAQPSAASSREAPTYRPTDLPTDQPIKKNPPLPPRKRVGIDLGILERVWDAFPRRSSPTGEYQQKGNKQAALKQINRVKATHGLTDDDIVAVCLVYRDHPKVKEGYVQSVEVFFGENKGRWLECWEVVQRERRERAEEA